MDNPCIHVSKQAKKYKKIHWQSWIKHQAVLAKVNTMGPTIHLTNIHIFRVSYFPEGTGPPGGQTRRLARFTLSAANATSQDHINKVSSGSVLFKTFFVRLFHLCVCVLFRFRPRRSSLMQRPPRGVRLRGLRVPVEASLDGLHGDALGRPPLVQGEQGLEQGVDVGLKALSLHPALQHLLHLVAGVGVLRDPDVVVAHPDAPE